MPVRSASARAADSASSAARRAIALGLQRRAQVSGLGAGGPLAVELVLQVARATDSTRMRVSAAASAASPVWIRPSATASAASSEPIRARSCSASERASVAVPAWAAASSRAASSCARTSSSAASSSERRRSQAVRASA